jgi:molybdate transport system substrate-binding protein
MNRVVSLLLLLAFFLTGCGTAATPASTAVPATETSTQATIDTPAATPAARTLIVFAAASLTDAFKEIAQAFQSAHPGVTVTFNFAGSQTLQTQVEQGAQPDVFASASAKQMTALVSEGFIDQSASRTFLNNKLVVILPADNPASLQGLQDLAKPGIKLVLAAEDVPVGNYARQALDLMDAKFGNGYKAKVLANVVSNEEDVKQVVAKVQLGEADAGIVYTSDAVAAPQLKSIEIPGDLNVIAKYPIAPLAKSPNAALAADFVAYVLSADGQSVLQKWGFTPAP